MARSESDSEGKERVLFYTSVAILVGVSYPFEKAGGYHSKLLLVRQRSSQSWGLVAGKLEMGETPWQAAWRELGEEANLAPGQVFLHKKNPRLVLITGEKNNSLGFIFEGHLENDLSPEGYAPESREVDLVKQFSIRDLVDLVHNPKGIYRPDFNLGLIKDWIWGYLSLKYAFEGPRFCEAVAQSWGLDEIGPRPAVSVVL